MSDSLTIFYSPHQPFKPALTLGQDLPKEVSGKPCHYFWKEMLPLGKYVDAKGQAFEINEQRRDSIVQSFGNAKAKGYKAFLPPSHKAEDRTPEKNLGWLIDVRVNQKGSIEGLHQVIGNEHAETVVRNASSICTRKDVMDASGNQYEELIDHNAIVPDPQLPGLGDFQPALAASRGEPEGAVVLQLAASQRRNPMIDFKKLRDRLGAAADVPDEKLIELADTKLGEMQAAVKTKDGELKLSRDAETAAKNQVVELQKTKQEIPNDSTLLLLSRSLKTERDKAIGNGGVSPECAKAIDELFTTNGKLNGLALSQQAGSTDYLSFRLWEILQSNKPVKAGSETAIQLDRQLPQDGPGQIDVKKQADDGEKVGKAYRDEQLKARGITP